MLEAFISRLHKVILFIVCCWHRIIGRVSIGVRTVVISQEKKILLVKHTYQPGWYLPGGGIKKHESLPEAAIRELREETGIKVLGVPILFGIYHHRIYGMSDYPVVFIVNCFEQIAFSSFEIKEIGWFDPSQLPRDTTPATRRRLKEVFHQVPQQTQW